MATDSEKEEVAEILGRKPHEVSADCDSLTSTQLTRLQTVLVEYRKVQNRYAVMESDGITADPTAARKLFRGRVARLIGWGDPTVGFIGTA